MREAKRKICFIIPTHWEAEMGGAQFQAKILLEHLIDSGRWEAFYLANWINREHRPEGYRIVEIPGLRWFRRFGYILDTRNLLKLLDEIRPDVIYQRVGCAYTGISAYYARQHPECRMIWHVANDSSFMPLANRRLPFHFLHWLDRKILQYGIRNATHIVAQTNHQRDLLWQQYRREPAAIISNFHPLPVCVPPKPTDHLSILWVANFKPSKRPEIFIELAREFAGSPGIRFTMIGGPYVKKAYQDDLEEKMAGLPNIEYLGARTQEEVNAAMAQAHLFVSTAAHEGFANTFIQAWLHRVPVVSLEVNPDGLLDGGGLGYTATGYESLVSTVKMLVADRGRLEALGSDAEAYARANFSERNVGALIRLIEEG